MYQIDGNAIVFTDQHFGIKGNAPSRQKVGAIVMKKMIEAVERNSASACIFCGDYFHQRNALTIDTLNIAHRCLQALAKRCKVYMILGNHDLFNKNSTDINSISIFRDIANIVVVDKPAEVRINKKKALLVPWLSDLSPYSKNSFDFLFGHFDISSKFIVASYSQDHSKTLATSNELSNEIDNDSDLAVPSAIDPKNEELLGSFIELAKPHGTIFAGHIHQHKEMVVKGRNFIFVGSPYQQNFGDYGYKCGYYVVWDDGSYSFNELEGLPMHVKIACSDILKDGISRFDFSCAKGNIVQKVYDVDISLEDDLAIGKKIAAAKPYEEVLPDYQVVLDFSAKDGNASQDNLVKMIKKSKLDYIKSYISQMDEKSLSSEGIKKDILFKVMKKYYDFAVGE